MERYERVKLKLKNNRNKSIINDYYSKEINKGKSYKASNMDKFSFTMLIFIIMAVLFYNYIESLIIAMILSLLLATIFYIIAVRVRNKSATIKKAKIVEELKSARIQREISQMNREEFVSYIKVIFDKYYLSDFHLSEDESIDLEGNINGKRYAVKCIKSSSEDRIIRKIITEFNRYINYLQYDDGIIITNSFYQEGEKENSSLMLFDFNDINKMLKSNHDYPTEEDINNYILFKYDDKSKELKQNIMIFNTKKIVRLYFISLILLVASIVVEYSLYYKIIGIMIFVLASILGGIRITEHLKSKSKIPLQR